MIKRNSLAVASLALLLLAACGSTGGLGDILGGGGNASNREIRGTVDSVDLNSNSIYLTNVSGYNMLSSGGSGSANAVRVYFSSSTPVDYQGQNYRPQDLERGDEVAVQVDENGNRLEAQSMRVVYNARGTSGTPTGSSGTYDTTLRGTITSIDTSRRTIQIDRGYGVNVAVEYDAAVPVYFNGKTYRAADLERGDEIEIRTRDLGSGRLLAQDITVTRSVSTSSTNGGIYGSQSQSTLRGTVRYIDTARRTIELESVNALGFNRGTTGGTVVVSYDTNTRVDVSGQLYPVTNLERGDVVEVQVQNPGATTLFASRIFLVRDVNSR